jgi:hypothetical protein
MVGRKKVMAIFFTTIFLTLLFSPCISAAEPLDQEAKMTIYLPGVTQNNYFTQIPVSNEDLQLITNDLENILIIINSTIALDSPGGIKITEEEWQQIGIALNELINTLKSFDENFPNVDTELLISNMITAFLNPVNGFFGLKAVISLGFGFTWIPFYDYDTFFGLIVRPMLTRHIFGFLKTTTLRETRNKIGCFRVITIAFAGLFINIGDIGTQNILGPTMYIGTALYIRS